MQNKCFENITAPFTYIFSLFEIPQLLERIARSTVLLGVLITKKTFTKCAFYVPQLKYLENMEIMKDTNTGFLTRCYAFTL